MTIVLPIVRAWLKAHSRLLADFEFIGDDVVITIWDLDKKTKQRAIKLSPDDQFQLVEQVLPKLLVILSGGT